jgi:hypothetical protein
MTGVPIMRLIEMKSPNGVDVISVHPSRLQSYENRGWMRVEPVAVEKPKPKRKRKTGGGN